MKTRRIYGKKNKTVSKRNKKKNSAKKRVYRRKTMKGGVRIEPFPSSINLSYKQGLNEKVQRAKDTRQFYNYKYKRYVPPTTRSEVLTPGLKHQKKYTQEAYKKKKKIAKDANRDLYQYKLDPYKYKLLTPEIKDVSIITALKLVFEKYPITRFSSYFGKNTGARQQTNIQSLTDLLNDELCGLDTDPETGNCTTGFTADQWANSKYCKAKYKAKSGLRYWDTGNKLCEYIPYAMKQLEKDYYTQNKSVGILLFKKKNTEFCFEWAYKYADLLTKEIVNIPVPTVLQLVFKKNPIKRFSGYFGTDVQARQLQNIAAEKMSSDLCNADNSYVVNCTTGFTADQWANSQYCSQNKGNKLCEYIPYAMKQIEKDYSAENNSGEILLFKKKDSTNELAFEWMMTPYEKLINYVKTVEPTTVEQLNKEDCLTEMPENDWKLQQNMKIVSENTDTVSVQITIPIFAMIYNAYYSKINSLENSNINNPYSALNEYTTEMNNLLNRCVPPSENQECPGVIPEKNKAGIDAIIHQINRNILVGRSFTTYIVTNGGFTPIKINTNDNIEVPVNSTDDMKKPWENQLSYIYDALATQNENDVYNQRLIFMLYLLPFFYEQVNTETQLILTRNKYAIQQLNKVGENALSIFENSNMYSFFVNKITETQGVSPEKGAVKNDHYNLFVKRDGTERQFTFYAMFVVVSMDDPEEPVAYCLSELMFSVDLNDPNFDQHFSPSKSLVDCSNKNQEYYANYPKMSINNYIHPYN